eukprot:TRINITY_DN6637_c0_g1_i1.p1 TRINITY_DN6637_c0_g1~~TRINITY_DN6637_c0_g1_i1.p1  ORF type:complete len:243 (+),score=24.23 TRINITY_DN6637_c0_g1_i1:82-810(+)
MSAYSRRWLPAIAWAYMVVRVSAQGPCDANPCLQNGVCMTDATQANGYKCICPPGWTGPTCEFVGDFCYDENCLNNGTCVDPATSTACQCRFGYTGDKCEIEEHFTLMQWKGIECEGIPWRCFHLQMDKCIDTGVTDGNAPDQANWFGKISFDEGNHYTVDLCWGENVDEPEETCKCKNHFKKIPKLGRNGLGPNTPGKTDSTNCHKLSRVTSSRLAVTTGMGPVDVNGDAANTVCQWVELV